MYFGGVLQGMTLEEKSMKFECPNCGAMPLWSSHLQCEVTVSRVTDCEVSYRAL